MAARRMRDCLQKHFSSIGQEGTRRINERVVEVPVRHFREETGELTNSDHLLDAPVASTDEV